jgi:hypothetical protein
MFEGLAHPVVGFHFVKLSFGQLTEHFFSSPPFDILSTPAIDEK